MAPTLQPGDGFIAVPSFIAGPPSEGDVVVFKPEELNNGNLVTHRIVRETEQGYITQGDGNPVTDQDGAEPPVQESQIKATGFEIGDTLLVLPKLGVIVMWISGLVAWGQQQLAGLFGTRALLGSQGLALILLGFGLVTYIIAAVLEGDSRREKTRSTQRRTGMLDPKTIIAGMTVFLMVILTVSMVLPGGAHQFQYVSAESDAEGPSVIGQGTMENQTFQVPSNGPFPTVSIFEPQSERISVHPSTQIVPGGTTESVTVSITAPPETGAFVASLYEHRYLAILPTGVILSLHQVHPLLPIGVINLLVGSGFALLALLLVGLDPIKVGGRSRKVPLRVKLRRFLK
jgi:signal peptidase